MIRNRARFVRPHDPPTGIQKREIVVQRQLAQPAIR
jgi:hypothetical protein